MAKTIRTVCQACHMECGVIAHVKDGQVIRIVGDPNHPMNKGFSCVKGRLEAERLYHPDRLQYPSNAPGKGAAASGSAYRGMKPWTASRRI